MLKDCGWFEQGFQIEEVETMLPKMKTAWNILCVISGVVASVIMTDLGHAAGAKDNVPLGRTPAAIVDGLYPAADAEEIAAAKRREKT